MLTMGDCGTSGTLRFVADTGENFVVVFGVHNWKKWGNMVTDLAKDLTGVVLNPSIMLVGQGQALGTNWTAIP